MRFRDDSGRVDHGQIGEMEMTNHIEEAAAELDVAEHYTKYEMVAESHMESAKAHALIAIAEQLKVMNLWKICSDEPADPWKQQLEAMVYDGNGFSDDVAEALGIKEEK